MVICAGACGGPSSSAPHLDALTDAGADAHEHKSDVAPYGCEQPIQAVIEAVDREGRPFSRDSDGVFLVPITAQDFAFDTGNSRNVSGRDVTYTFSSDCFPTVTVRAPVLGGFSAHEYGLEKTCQFMVAILDLGRPHAPTARAQGSLRVVP